MVMEYHILMVQGQLNATLMTAMLWELMLLVLINLYGHNAPLTS